MFSTYLFSAPLRRPARWQAASNIQERRVARQEKIVKASQRAQFGKTGGQIAGSSLAFLVDTASQFSIEKNLVLTRKI